jgi:RimJ/RimL family protein N-acetyltransferase
MSQFEGVEIDLIPLSADELRRLASGESVHDFASAPAGALPPPHVAARALSQLETGTPAFWCVPFLIVARGSGVVLGGCTFKGAPVNGCAEIGYGVAKSMRGRGVATSAVEQLLNLSTASGNVQLVVADILPDNTASSKVVSRLGFTRSHTFVDSDGETVVRWTYPVAT